MYSIWVWGDAPAQQTMIIIVLACRTLLRFQNPYSIVSQSRSVFYDSNE